MGYNNDNKKTGMEIPHLGNSKTKSDAPSKDSNSIVPDKLWRIKELFWLIEEIINRNLGRFLCVLRKFPH